MSTVHTLQVNMTRGALTPLVHARVDIEHYQAGLADALNVVPLRYGGITRAPGTIYGGPTKFAGSKARHIPFEFTRDQVYAIEAGNLYFRFWTIVDGIPARIEDGGSPVEVVTPYLAADVDKIKLRQSGDVLYIVCEGYDPKTLTRMSETDWVLDDYETQDGPFLPVNTTSINATPAARGVLAELDHTAAGTAGSVEIVTAGTSDWYTIISATVENGNLRVPSSWTLEGYTGSAWVIVDSRAGETGWDTGENRIYTFPNTTAFTKYRFNWSGLNGATDAAFSIRLNQAAAEQTPFNLSFSNDLAFTANDVGRLVRFLGSDGRWRWMRITSVTSGSLVQVVMYGPGLPDLGRTTSWRLGALYAGGGPSAIAIYEDRIIMAGFAGAPLTGFGSVSADYDNFRVSAPVVDDDGLEFRLTGGKLNRALWMLEGKDIVIGTAGSIRAVGRNENARAFAPGNIRQRPETSVSASSADPVSIENMVLFLDGDETRLYEMAYTYEVDGYLARELSALNEHLFSSGVVEIAYQSHPHKIVWCRRSDGTLVAASYDREQKVFGATLVDVGGFVESIMPLPGNKRTDLFMVVVREINGVEVRYVECLAEFYREDFTLQGVPVYAACAALYDGPPVAVVTGVDWLEGETVGIWADEVDLGDATVTGGEVALPSGYTGEQIVIGKRMPWRAETLRLSQIGNRDGSGLGRKVQINEALIDLHETAGIRVGSLSQVDVLRFEDEAGLNPGAPPPLRTGMYPLTVEDSWSNNGQLVIEGDRMYPATIRALSLKIEGEP